MNSTGSGLRERLAASFGIALVAGCATVGPPQDGRPVLETLRFEGNDHLSSSYLSNHVATTPSTGLLFFRRVLRTWDADVFEIDRQRLLRTYRQLGFFAATIGPARVDRGDAGWVTVTVKIDEGRRSMVTEVRLLGLEALAADEREDLAEKLPQRTDAGFDELLYEKTKAAVQLRLREHGFAGAEVAGEVRVSVEEARAIILLTCTPGQRYRLGRVVVSGNRAIAASLIAGATGLDRDQPFAPSRLDLAQQRVYNLGVFSGVRVGLEPLGDNGVAAVRVSVREAPFQTVRVGLGVQLEQSRAEVPRLRLEYTNRSIFGGVRRLELATQVGYALTPSITAPDKTGLVTLNSAQITLPQALFGLDFVGRGEFARELQPGFNYNQVSARAALLLRWGKFSFAGSFNFVRTFDAVLDLGQTSQTTTGGTAAAALSNCLPACSLPYPELRVTFDARDDVVEPHFGFYASASVARTLPGLRFDYTRLDPEARVYLPLGPLVTVALRAQLGALIQPAGANPLLTPFNQRFFGGGQNLLRGYAPQGQGPRLGAQRNPDGSGYATAAVAIGGNGEVLASAELRIKTDFLLKNLMVVPFFDAGRVTSSWADTFTGQPELAPGLGLRYLTPFGPARLDVGWLLNPQDEVAQPFGLLATKVSTSCGSEVHCISISRWAWHLTLGEAF